MFYKGKNVLVAGGAGMVGQSLIGKLLDQGAYVRATQYKRRRISMNHNALEVVDCDFFDESQGRDAFKDMDIVLMAAAKVRGAGVLKEGTSSLLMYNLHLESKLIYLAAEVGINKCGFISSSYVYPQTSGPNIESEGFKGDPWIPINYGLGWTKRYLETLCKHFHMTSKTNYSIVRPTSIYGPHDNFNPEECHAVPALIVKAINRMDPFEVWGDGETIRCFTHVEDLVDGLMLTLERYSVAEPINICTPEANTIKEVVKTILDLEDFEPRIVYNSSRPSVVQYKVSDPSRARELIGWEAKIKLEEGLRDTIDWYVKEGRQIWGKPS